jgi:peptide/nickel transport system substrate-binding protein
VEDKQKLSRRDFLRISAIGAASAMVAACGGQNTTQGGGGAGTTGTVTGNSAEGQAVASAVPNSTSPPSTGGTAASADVSGTVEVLKAPGSFKEAPMLADQVKAGKLPAVAERLPKNPYVVPHAWVKPGQYGGTLQLTNSWGGDGVGTVWVESMYGHSPLRWLKDGQAIGPGLVESWEHNADASQWTFRFREGLKWSDGQPWSTDDIMYWWNDMVNNPEANESPPDEARSGKGTLAKFEPVDKNTLRLIFDAPAPLTADRMAMWVNMSIGPRWMAPAHYMKQFHPKYSNGKYKDFKEHEKQINNKTSAGLPVMTGWKLTEYKEGTSTSWERNPFYWCVTKEGDQLPYIDRVHVTGYQDKEVEKVNYLGGKVDFTHHWVLALTDVAAAKQAQNTSKCEVRFWDDGGGTGISYFLNYDYKDEKMRKLIREPKFRQALSHAMNRADIQKNLYFNRGELTTGTMSPKAIEWRVNDEGKQVYASWRDAYLKYDPEKAKQLLDSIGLKAGADGMRTMPDGSPLLITLDYASDTSRNTISQNELLAANFKAVGVNAKLNPVPKDGRDEKWRAGEIMSNADWGVGDGPNCLVYPQWMVPLENTRWAPLEGSFYNVRGTPKENAEKDVDPYKRTPPRMAPEPGGPVDKLTQIYDKTKVEPDAMKRHRMVWDMVKIHISDGPFFIGTVANAPLPFLVKAGLGNVPQQTDLALGGFCGPWIHPTPAVYDPETWFWDNPSQHT